MLSRHWIQFKHLLSAWSFPPANQSDSDRTGHKHPDSDVIAQCPHFGGNGIDKLPRLVSGQSEQQQPDHHQQKDRPPKGHKQITGCSDWGTSLVDFAC
jgi:hypothetical protein